MRLGNQVSAIVVHHAKEKTRRWPQERGPSKSQIENSDDVGNRPGAGFLAFAFCQNAIACGKRQRALPLRFEQANVFRSRSPLVAKVLEKRYLLVVERSDSIPPALNYSSGGTLA